MKVIMTAIAALGAMTTFVGSAFADVSFTIRFGSSPSINTYRTYDSYRQPVYHNPYNRNYDHSYQHNVNSRVIVREIVPSPYYGNSWNYPTAPRFTYPANFPTTTRSTYSPYRSHQGERYIVEKKFIRIR